MSLTSGCYGPKTVGTFCAFPPRGAKAANYFGPQSHALGKLREQDAPMKKTLSALALLVAIIAAAIGAGVGKEISKTFFTPSTTSQQQIDEALINGFNQAARQANAKGAIMVDSDTRWDKTTVGPGARLNYFYSFPKHPSKDIDKNIILENIRSSVSKFACSNTEMKPSLKLGATYTYIYSGSDNVEIARFEINKTKCPQP